MQVVGDLMARNRQVFLQPKNRSPLQDYQQQHQHRVSSFTQILGQGLASGQAVTPTMNTSISFGRSRISSGISTDLLIQQNHVLALRNRNFAAEKLALQRQLMDVRAQEAVWVEKLSKVTSELEKRER
jgi:hypothetical protein